MADRLDRLERMLLDEKLKREDAEVKVRRWGIALIRSLDAYARPSSFLSLISPLSFLGSCRLAREAAAGCIWAWGRSPWERTPSTRWSSSKSASSWPATPPWSAPSSCVCIKRPRPRVSKARTRPAAICERPRPPVPSAAVVRLVCGSGIPDARGPDSELDPDGAAGPDRARRGRARAAAAASFRFMIDPWPRAGRDVN